MAGGRKRAHAAVEELARVTPVAVRPVAHLKCCRRSGQLFCVAIALNVPVVAAVANLVIALIRFLLIFTEMAAAGGGDSRQMITRAGEKMPGRFGHSRGIAKRRRQRWQRVPRKHFRLCLCVQNKHAVQQSTADNRSERDFPSAALPLVRCTERLRLLLDAVALLRCCVCCASSHTPPPPPLPLQSPLRTPPFTVRARTRD